MTDPIVIGIAGPAGAGKDTAALRIQELEPSFQIKSFAHPMKVMMKYGLGLSDAQLYGEAKEQIDHRYGKTPRYMLQTIGTEWGRNMIGEDIWLNALMYSQGGANLIVPDVRFENEAEAIRRNGTLIHIAGRSTLTGQAAIHDSENGINVEMSDIVIQNTGSMSDFFNEVDWALHAITTTSGMAL